MKPVLLDTHVALWVTTDSPRLGPASRAAIDAAAAVFVSAASVWEIAIKVALGKLDAPLPIGPRFGDSGLRELPVDWAGADAITDVDLDHGDPFDRLIVAQARSRALTLLTADRHLLRQVPRLTRDARR